MNGIEKHRWPGLYVCMGAFLSSPHWFLAVQWPIVRGREKEWWAQRILPRLKAYSVSLFFSLLYAIYCYPAHTNIPCTTSKDGLGDFLVENETLMKRN